MRVLDITSAFSNSCGGIKRYYREKAKALVVELKWNQTAETAMQQIKEKKYPDSLRGYTGNLLLVAINYDKKTKKDQCLIEKVV